MSQIAAKKEKSLKVVKHRFVFNTQKDVELLKLCLQHNPWQNGSDNWSRIMEGIKSFGWDIKIRTIKAHLALLIDQYKKEELVFRTGSEEVFSERGSLLKELESILVQSQVPINSHLGADEFDENIIEKDSCESLINSMEDFMKTCSDPVLPKKSSLQSEKVTADKERNEIVNEGTPGPNSFRMRRQKLSFEDDLIKQRQEHEIEMDVKRFKLDEMNFLWKHEEETKKIELEKMKIELEIKKEERKAEENKRKDQISMNQLEIQSSLLKVLMENKIQNN